MELKIMITGRMEKISGEIRERLRVDRRCSVEQCLPRKNHLFETALTMMPHIVIICLRDENPETVRTYDVLSEFRKTCATSVLVVANGEDEEMFTRFTGLDRASILPRPLSLPALYYKINEIRDGWKDADARLQESMEEFANPNASIKYPRKQVLVVDDDPEQLMQIREHLREFYDVTLVPSGKKILKALERAKPDVILLDYMMPGMGGADVLEMLRADKEYKKIPVIFLTGISERETVAKIIQELKPDGFVLKPTKKSELVGRIIDVLG